MVLMKHGEILKCLWRFLRIIAFSVISYKHILFPSNSVEIGYLCLIHVEVLVTQDFICVHGWG